MHIKAADESRRCMLLCTFPCQLCGSVLIHDPGPNGKKRDVCLSRHCSEDHRPSAWMCAVFFFLCVIYHTACVCLCIYARMYSCRFVTLLVFSSVSLLTLVSLWSSHRLQRRGKPVRGAVLCTSTPLLLLLLCFFFLPLAKRLIDIQELAR